MRWFIAWTLGNPHMVVVVALPMAILGALAPPSISPDISPVLRNTAVPILTFFRREPSAKVEKEITLRMEKWGKAPAPSVD